MKRLNNLMVLLGMMSLILVTQSCETEEVLNVQNRLDAGETPIDIYNSNKSSLESLYGKTYAGGLIFYLNTNDGNGLVAASVDQSTNATWGCFPEMIGGTSDAIGTGQANTDTIVNFCGEPGIAARICDDLVYDGYDDWFLPSLFELTELYRNLHLNEFGGFNGFGYWSSTESNTVSGWTLDFSDGIPYSCCSIIGGVPARTRAVRAF